MEEYDLDDFIKCRKCSKMFIFEEYNHHVCSVDFKGIKEIGIDYHFDGEKDENNDQVFIAKGLDGIIYRLVKCDHNHPHTSADPTIFDSEKNRRRIDRAQFQYIYY